MKNFQLISIIVFIALAIFGILVFSGAIPIGKSDTPGAAGTVVLWGTIKQTIMTSLIEQFNNVNKAFVVKYVQKDVDTFDQDLLEALADGTGPDMFFLPDNLAFHYSNKIFTVPFTSYPIASFENSFAGAGDVFLTGKGILAFPISIDPLMMYYNRSILDANFITSPPIFWDDLVSLIPKLTKKDESNKIIKSTIALGHFSNVAHAKDILATLFMQVGNKIVSEKNGVFQSNLSSVDNGGSNLASVLKFYTDFADPNNEMYSWNKLFLNSDEAFSKEDVAFYLGFGSELMSLVNRNPNENLAISSVPQVRGASFKVTGARVTGIALASSSKNIATAFIVASLMSTGDFASQFAIATNTAPARRELLKAKPADTYSPIIYDSALYARSWIDPSSKDTDNIFRNMIDSVLSNNMTPKNAIADTDGKLGLLLLK